MTIQKILKFDHFVFEKALKIPCAMCSSSCKGINKTTKSEGKILCPCLFRGGEWLVKIASLVGWGVWWEGGGEGIQSVNQTPNPPQYRGINTPQNINIPPQHSK